MRFSRTVLCATLGIALVAGGNALAKKKGKNKGFRTAEPVQIIGDSAATDEGWKVTPLLTIGETRTKGATDTDVNEKYFGHRPVGILDGIGAFPRNKKTLRLLVNHELSASLGYAYKLKNGVELTGARVSYFDIDRKSRKVVKAGPAYDTIYDRAGDVVTDTDQIREGIGSDSDGMDRLCSSYGATKGTHGVADDIYFTGEETSSGFGGQEFVLDVKKHDLYCAPMLGRAAFENVTTVENFGTDYVLVLIGDDREGAPLYLYVGEKGAEPDEGYEPPAFLKRNGLGYGRLYAWVPDNGDEDPSDFNGTGSVRTGKFKAIEHFNPSKAGEAGYDSLGFVSLSKQESNAFAAGAFRFSRPEDVATNPYDGTQVAFASTGRSGFAGGADSWGTTYLVDLDNGDLKTKLAKSLADIDDIACDLTILYAGDDAGDGQFSDPDEGLRSPDNLDWADNGMIYLQEDRSVGGFGAVSGVEASAWELDPTTGKLTRILEIDRTAVPAGQTDTDPNDLGDWESSGVLDITEYLKTKKGETVLVLDVQAHSLRGGGLARKATDSADLVQGGQLVVASKTTKGKK